MGDSLPVLPLAITTGSTGAGGFLSSGDRDFSFKMENMIKKHDLNLKWEFPWVRPRYKRVPWVTKIYDDILPKFKAVVNESTELQKKLQEYLAPDYDYYIKAV